MNRRPPKPRHTGVTEIRGPYYSAVGKRYLEDVLATMGEFIDSLKFAGGSFTLLPRAVLVDIIELCHDYDVLVSTGGFIETVITQGPSAVGSYIRECRMLGFDIVELSCGFITLPRDDWLRLGEEVKRAGLKPEPEIGIQFGAGGSTAATELEAEGTRDPDWVIRRPNAFWMPARKCS
jgi:phosphosulfolactate synthase (CoM biosynthesis protein A)